MNGTVPEFLEPPPGPGPLRVRPVGWLLALPALLALPFVPGRVGPRLSRAGWRLTLAVHVAGLLFAVLVVSFAASWTYDARYAAWGVPNRPQSAPNPVRAALSAGGSEALRTLLTASVNMLYTLTEDRGDIYALLGGLLGIHALCWIIAILAMPFIAAGERPALLLRRALKLTLWSSAVSSAVLAALVVVIIYVGTSYPDRFQHLSWEMAFTSCGVMCLGWWSSLIVRLGRRYAGPAEGPAFQRTRPRCVRCRYLLTGLPHDGKCPECGLAVAESLARSDACVPWQKARHLWNRPGAWVSTVWVVLRRPPLLRALAASGGVPEAVRFAAWTGGLIALGMAILVASVAHEFSTRDIIAYYTAGLLALGAVWVGTRTAVLLGLSLFAIILGWRPRKDLRVATIAVCYGSGLFLVPILVAVVIFGTIMFLTTFERADRSLQVPWVAWVDWGTLSITLFLVVTLSCLAWVIWRIARAVPDTARSEN